MRSDSYVQILREDLTKFYPTGLFFLADKACLKHYTVYINIIRMRHNNKLKIVFFSTITK